MDDEAISNSSIHRSEIASPAKGGVAMTVFGTLSTNPKGGHSTPPSQKTFSKKQSKMY